MKKTIIMSLMMLFLVSQVFAQPTNAQTGLDMAGQRLVRQEENQARLVETLQNVLDKSSNEEVKSRIQANIDRFQENYQNRLQTMDIVEINDKSIDGEVEIIAKQDVKFLGFIPGKATTKFNIDAEGKIQEKAAWYRFLYSQDE